MGFWKSKIRYEPLDEDETEIRPSRSGFPASNKQQKKSPLLLLLRIALLALYTVVVVAVSRGSFRIRFRPQTSIFYSPAMVAVEEEIKVFNSRPNPKYFGPPTKERNAAWENICGEGHGILSLRLTEEEKKMMPKSVPDLAFPENGIYALNMCHQLHCLNRIRLSFYNEYFQDETPELRRFHREHCIDHIRENIMCRGDVALDYWAFTNANKNESFMRLEVPHQCRNFDKIIEWSDRNKLDQGTLPL